MITKDEKKIIRDYQLTFSTPHGAKVLADLSERCFELTSTFDCDNQYATAYNEGRRSILLGIKRRMAIELEAD